MNKKLSNWRYILICKEENWKENFMYVYITPHKPDLNWISDAIKKLNQDLKF